MKNSLFLLPVFGALLACGLAGTALSMKETQVPPGDATWNKIDAQAKKLGWKTERGDDQSAYAVTAFPAAGNEDKKVFFTLPLNKVFVEFNCDGMDKDECIAAANKILTPAFGYAYKD